MNVRRLTGEAVLYGIGNALEAVAKFAVLPIIGRFLAPDQLGIADVITATIGWVYYAVSLNLDQALIRYYYDESEADRRRLATTHAMLIVATGSLVVALGGAIVYLLRSDLSNHAAWACALVSLPLTIMGDHMATLFRLRHEPMHHVTLLSVRVLGWAIVVTALLVVWHAGVVSIFAGLFLGALAALVVSVRWLRHVYASWGRLRFLWRGLRFSLPTIPAALASWGILHGPRYFLALGASTEEVGYYGVGVRIGYLVSFIGVSFVMAWAPFVMGIKDGPEVHATVGRGLLYFISLNAVLVIPLAAFAREVVRVLIGPLYVPASGLVGPMLVAALLSNVGLFLFVQLSVAERTSWQSISYLFGVAGMAILNLLLIPRWQSAGATAATVGGHVIMVAVMFAAAQRFFAIPVASARIAGALASLGGVLVGAAWIDHLGDISVAGIASKVLLVLAAWGLCLIALGPGEIGPVIRLGREMLSRRGVRDEVPGGTA